MKYTKWAMASSSQAATVTSTAVAFEDWTLERIKEFFATKCGGWAIAIAPGEIFVFEIRGGYASQEASGLPWFSPI